MSLTDGLIRLMANINFIFVNVIAGVYNEETLTALH